jgi:hypothetical protein
MLVLPKKTSLNEFICARTRLRNSGANLRRLLGRLSSDSQGPSWKRFKFFLTPDLFYKGRSQEKTHLPRLEVFLLLSPLDRARFILTCRAMCSVAGQDDPVDWVFSTSGFHCFFATKPVSSETSKAERRSNLATIVLFGTRGP